MRRLGADGCLQQCLSHHTGPCRERPCCFCNKLTLTPTSCCAAGNDSVALMGLPLSVCGLMFGSTLARSLRWLLQNDSMQDICRRSGIFLEVFGLMRCLGELMSPSEKPATTARCFGCRTESPSLMLPEVLVLSFSDARDTYEQPLSLDPWAWALFRTWTALLAA